MRIVTQSREEIDRVVSSLSNFSPYIRHLAEASGRQVPLDVSETAAPEQVAEGGITEVDGVEMRRPLSGVLLAEFVASLLERDDELRLKKALILIQVDGFDEPKPVMKPQVKHSSCLPSENIVLAGEWPGSAGYPIVQQLLVKGFACGHEW